MHAVARGAAYYGTARHGRGCASAAALPRTYYIGIEIAMPAVPGMMAPLKALTVAAFGMEEGTDLRIPDREFGLIVGEPAEFRFFCSAVRKNDHPRPDDRRLRRRPGRTRRPWKSSSPAGEGAIVPVSFETVVTETGVLQLWCVAHDGRRWKLEFNVREKVAA